MSIPLVRNNTKDAINTSIIAIKKNLERINSLLGLMDSSEPDLSGFATKQELEDAVTEINNTIDEVETSLQPVDTVTSGDMHSVTSNAVNTAIGGSKIKRASYSATYDNTSMSSSNGYKTIPISSEIQNSNIISVYYIFGQTSSSRGLQITPVNVANGNLYFNYYKPQSFAEPIPIDFIIWYRV